jgi:hypothetical protein
MVAYSSAFSRWGMQGPNKERWRELCEQAAKEQDPVKLHRLIKEINDLLEAKEARLKGNQPPGTVVTDPNPSQ